MSATDNQQTVYYVAAGGVVIHQNQVLVLNRPGRNEIRLPKGHIDPGETAEAAALREVAEESGYTQLTIVADLGVQIVRFTTPSGQNVVRREQYFLMELASPTRDGAGEDQFEPLWLTCAEAEEQLTYEAEKEWVRRACAVINGRSAPNQTSR
ncbi:MAG: NUDIX domain-containing protein [Chloroflexi bacterium]|nr:MAG: NUDIX domain-containing protein [Chloroflexota bacterium]